jgi:hypothetical protein
VPRGFLCQSERDGEVSSPLLVSGAFVEGERDGERGREGRAVREGEY